MHSTNTATNNMLNIIMSHYKWDTSVQEYEKKHIIPYPLAISIHSTLSIIKKTKFDYKDTIIRANKNDFQFFLLIFAQKT